ncbi:MAG: hypothetical protein WBA16_03730 [Nonlabens sp.]
MYIGSNKIDTTAPEIKGALVELNGEKYYKISNSDMMRPFFMSIISNSNHWMFVSSNGGLTAGRQNAESSLFPYYTDDKITEAADFTGSRTLIRIKNDYKTFLWEPFSPCHRAAYRTETNLYKNALGNKVLFEELNHDLGISFSYEWCNSDEFGFVKRSTVVNLGNNTLNYEILDGIQNILPYGVGSDLQNSRSNLVDAYKKCELEKEQGLGIYSLSAIIVDKAEPSESFMATTVWSIGIDNEATLLSSKQLDTFRKGHEVTQEIDVKAEKGAYFICSHEKLESGESKEFYTVAEVNQSMNDINHLKKSIKEDPSGLRTALIKSIEKGSVNLKKLAAASDGLQLGSDRQRNTRHFANTMFNIMRGGIFDNNYTIEKSDFHKYLRNANKEVHEKFHSQIAQLEDQFDLATIIDLSLNSDDADFVRLAHEYLPLKFSRRHGDPSRPWNKFSINTTDGDGNKILDYEGNWRDIFQNWEALAYSYPYFLENMIYKFLNASTFDGYNPYRVIKDGFDWETIEPDDPWSYIGYWGDHQIIYLLKFLEAFEAHEPGSLNSLLDRNVFVYANVPYRIKSYHEIVADPKDTILFDHEADQTIRNKREKLGADGALLFVEDQVYQVSFLEKILATVLAKISNFVPEAGIWMNTQRPEWNDANNALVGNGVSMVTLNYLYRFLDFFGKTLEHEDHRDVEISTELVELFHKINDLLGGVRDTLSRKLTNQERKNTMDALGTAADRYRTGIYTHGFSGRTKSLNTKDLVSFVKIAKEHLAHTIDANKRNDNLFHSYNLITIKSEGVSINYLPEMLEGQVAVLSSGYISLQESLKVMDALKSSALFRPDQYSYLLYPDKDLARFTDKNNIPDEMVSSSKLLQTLLDEQNNDIIEKDVLGQYHYNGTFNNADSLEYALDELPSRYRDLVSKEKSQLLDDFETLFNHKAFTGRSGTFFGYEGLGSIYWHMVSKLVLAVMETCVKAIETTTDEELIGKLLEHYYEMNEGIGVHKSPELYGAFPTDPYSHTPGNKGAQQPGMTGQVKEDILSRMMELGVFIENGAIVFNPRMLRKEELLKQATTFDYYNVAGNHKSIDLETGSMAFTYCQIPVIYSATGDRTMVVTRSNGVVETIQGLNLGKSISPSIFDRSGLISKIEVNY